MGILNLDNWRSLTPYQKWLRITGLTGLVTAVLTVISLGAENTRVAKYIAGAGAAGAASCGVRALIEKIKER